MNIIQNAPATLVFVLAAVDMGLIVVETVTGSVFPPAIEGRGYYEEIVNPGETVLVTWELVKRTGCPGENHRVWVGENGFTMTESVGPTTLPMTEDFVTYSIPTQIPDQAPEGLLELTVVGYYQCIGSPRSNFELGPVEFTVEEPEQ